MGFLRALIIAELLICCYEALTLKRSTCEYGNGHTMCLTDVGTEIAISDAGKKEIVDLHNKLRAKVSPTAGHMLKVIWDDELAAIATKWAKQCKFDHDKGYNRATKDDSDNSEGKVTNITSAQPSVNVGQNGAFDAVSWSQAINGWYNEVNSFAMGKGSTDGKVTGHYTQVVKDDVAKIGCGQAKCPPGSSPSFSNTALFCNYAEGQLLADLKNPYTEGASCEKCEGHCDDELKLCDCGGKLCENGGIMQYDTCTCKCSGIYKGDTCAEADCDTPDKEHCGSYEKGYCTIYANVPKECPHKCDIC